MGIYDRYVLPRLIDLGCGIGVVRQEREKIVPRARGEVLEIGIGSGHNLPCYDPSQVQKVWGVDPSPELLRRAARRAEETGLDVELLEVEAERLALPDASLLPDASFDTAVITFTLCSVEDPLAVLRGAARVLKPGGQLLFIEHGLSPDERVRRWQDRLTPLWKRVAGGCHLNRPIAELIEAAGFEMGVRQARGAEKRLAGAKAGRFRG